MNDEMKEPDEEKALNESDERKPDFKAEQFSDGASDTPPLKLRHQTKMAAHAKMKKTTHF